MKCFSSHAHNERIYDVLSGAKTVLENGKPALGMFPVPGLAPVAVAGQYISLDITHRQSHDNLRRTVNTTPDDVSNDASGFLVQASVGSSGQVMTFQLRSSSSYSWVTSSNASICLENKCTYGSCM